LFLFVSAFLIFSFLFLLIPLNIVCYKNTKYYFDSNCTNKFISQEEIENTTIFFNNSDCECNSGGSMRYENVNNFNFINEWENINYWYEGKFYYYDCSQINLLIRYRTDICSDYITHYPTSDIIGSGMNFCTQYRSFSYSSSNGNCNPYYPNGDPEIGPNSPIYNCENSSTFGYTPSSFSKCIINNNITNETKTNMLKNLSKLNVYDYNNDCEIFENISKNYFDEFKPYSSSQIYSPYFCDSDCYGKISYFSINNETSLFGCDETSSCYNPNNQKYYKIFNAINHDNFNYYNFYCTKSFKNISKYKYQYYNMFFDKKYNCITKFDYYNFDFNGTILTKNIYSDNQLKCIDRKQNVAQYFSETRFIESCGLKVYSPSIFYETPKTQISTPIDIPTTSISESVTINKRNRNILIFMLLFKKIFF